MAHKVYGGRLALREAPAWHGLGEVFPEDDPRNAQELTQEVGADYEVAKLRPGILLPSGQWVDMPGKWRLALIPNDRDFDPTTDFWNEVEDEFQVIQNMTLAQVADQLPGRVETLGALDDGKSFFIAKTTGFETIAGEDYKSYFVIHDRKDGSGGVNIFYTPVRVVCWNTLSFGESSASYMARLSHVSPDLVGDIAFKAQLAQRAERARIAISDLLTALSEGPEVGDMEAANYLEAVYPYDPIPNRAKDYESLNLHLRSDEIDWTDQAAVDALIRELDLEQHRAAFMRSVKSYSQWEREKGYTDEYREAAFDSFVRFNDEFPQLARSPYALVQAVAECEDYRRGQKQVAQQILLGERATTKARSVSLAIGMFMPELSKN